MYLSDQPTSAGLNEKKNTKQSELGYCSCCLAVIFALNEGQSQVSHAISQRFGYGVRQRERPGVKSLFSTTRLRKVINSVCLAAAGALEPKNTKLTPVAKGNLRETLSRLGIFRNSLKVSANPFMHFSLLLCPSRSCPYTPPPTPPLASEFDRNLLFVKVALPGPFQTFVEK